MKWETAFRVVAHELRSPAGVISGYTRLLKSGRLDGEGESNALAQIDRASERLQHLGEAASHLSHWVGPRPATAPHETSELLGLIDQAVLTSAAHDRVVVAHGQGVSNLRLRTTEPMAVATALSATINATIRELATSSQSVQVGVYRANREGWCDVLIASQPFDPAKPPVLESCTSFGLLESGGLGLQLVLACAVLEAHGGEWCTRAEMGVNGVRLPVETH